MWFISCLSAVDKSLSASLGDAREAMINAAVDMLSAYGSCLSAGQRLGQLPCLYQLRLVPLYVLAMLKSVRSYDDCRTFSKMPFSCMRNQMQNNVLCGYCICYLEHLLINLKKLLHNI